MILSFKQQFKPQIITGTKIHTIREDKPNRWERGRKIHFATGVRTKNYECFKEGECASTQKVYMSYEYNDLIKISVGNKELFSYQERLEFAKNDGFDDWQSFFDWFYPLIMATQDNFYKAKLIHWTDKRY